MSRPLKITALAVLALLVAGVALYLIGIGGDEEDAPAQVVAEDDHALIAGQVVDHAGRPVQDANVFAGSAHTSTDDGGHFSFYELADEPTPIDATADGHARGGVDQLGRPIVDPDDVPIDDLQLVLPRAASLSGRIVAGDDAVADASISLSYLHAEDLQGRTLDPFIVSEVTTSDDEGRFTIDAFAPGRLQLFVEANDHPFTESEELYFRPGRHRDDIVVDLAPSGLLEGTVTDEEGSALEATLIARPQGPENRPHRVSTDHSGRFIIPRLPADDYTIEVRADGHRTIDDHSLSIGVDDHRSEHFELQRADRLVGYVFEPDGTPVNQAHVQIRSADGQQDRRLRTGADGHFAWDNIDLDSAPFVGIASSPGHESSEEKTLSLDAENEFTITPGGTIRGRVVDAQGQPVQEYRLGLRSIEMDEPEHYARNHMPRERINDPDGAFEFGPLRSGRYRLVAWQEGQPPVSTDVIRLSPGDDHGPITLTMEAGSTLRGDVVDADTGEAVSDAHITFIHPIPGRQPPFARSDGDGSYQLDDLPSGPATIRVRHNLYQTEIIGGLAIPQDGSLSFNIELEPVGDDPTGIYVHGIGASLTSSSDGVAIGDLQDNSPAARSGLREGDLIVGVDGQDTSSMTSDQIVELIRGEPGTSANLRVRRAGRGARTISVDRERIFIPEDRPVRE